MLFLLLVLTTNWRWCKLFVIYDIFHWDVSDTSTYFRIPFQPISYCQIIVEYAFISEYNENTEGVVRSFTKINGVYKLEDCIQGKPLFTIHKTKLGQFKEFVYFNYLVNISE